MSYFYTKSAGLALCTLFSASTLFAQQSVTGKVTDATGPVSGVTVSVKGTSRGTQTAADGSFTIQAAQGETLRFSNIGYKATEIIVGSTKTINVTLTDDASALDEVVVTAMGIKRAPKELGYAMSTVGAEELTKTGSPNFAGALYGKAPGVRISAAPGGATSGININIRGTNSITGNSQPLVIIDGVPMRQTTFNNSDYWGDQRARGNGLEDLNPEDIENITILKGASAAALYGSEAMNGVVLVTTKSGKGSKGFSVDFNATYTHDQIAYLPRFQDVRGPGYSLAYANGGQAEDKFFYYSQDRAINGVTRGVLPATINFGPKFDGQPTIAWDGTVRPYEAQNSYNKFFNNPNNTTFNLALGHTTENSNTRFSITRQDNQMTSLDSYNKKNIANLNSSFKLWNNFTTDVVVNYINQHTHNRPFLTDRLINNFTGMISTWDNPEWYLDRYKTSQGYKFVTGTNPSLTPEENLTYNGYKTDVLDYIWNTKARQYDENSNRLIGSLTNTWQITKDFSVRGRFSADMTNNKIDDKQPNERPISLENTGYYSLQNQSANIYYTDLLASYSKSVTPDIKLGAMAGYTATKSQTTNMNSYTDGGLSVRDWFDINASVNQARTTNQKLNSLRDAVFGTLNFNFKDYWFVEGTLRRERISQMHPDNNVLYYPSVNSSLILSEAFDLPSAFNYAKLRGSWGIVGNYPTIYQSALSYTQATLGNQGSGTAVLYTNIPTSSFGNEKILPETKHEIEFGLETRLFNNRLGFDITYYNGKIVDQILNYTLPISTGSTSILANVGTLRNKGWEFAITGTPIQNGNFRWNTVLNFSMNKNVVEELPGGATELLHRDYDGAAAQLISKVGQPMGDIMTHPIALDDSGNKIVQANGLYKIDADKWEKKGNAMPKAVGGFINTFTYKSFTLDALIDFRLGGHVMPTGINWMKSRGLLEETLTNMDAEHGGLSYYLDGNGKGVAYNGTSGPNGQKVYDDGMLTQGVLADGSTNTNIISQAYYYAQTYNWGGPQYSNSNYGLYVQKNNYFKMREISLGYKLPSAVAAKLRAKNVQISAFGRNLFFLYRSIKDLDPEQMTGGSNWINNVSNAGTSPATRTYGLMVRASF
ncbi:MULTISPECIES: SusC/RagA family TonB-linked outer membrane protein [Sphingobacterium]|jgi:iron complex outermembrane receptor protein|uniref:SusC/RagA family TonB-linked outer membrane protein n=1 Tax=Sphingobacterium TaxID=28453 RepID=UPI00097F0A2D|nr:MULTISPECIES: SusC/RagA family TonB-linked outer membrane protein [Sphingobacterium]UPZ37097.1 SusC/RagA family TonB-linked outer membrane protein [Sphingobacterium sp. PCS056]WGQ16330.1 SusC/RagA family TonB-linked outer membrane protein [Sphingobacterium faecium]SJN30328.1 SusC, outer membrane protein involved in starch binding [Sphingobacterium faecium PCAi_F2.5]